MTKPEHWHYCAGWDHFTPDPGEWKGPEYCRACNAEMNIKRDCEGPTSSIMAMGGRKRKYDSFACPNAGEPWHTQLIKLKEMVEKTPSRSLAALLEQEINEIMEKREPTKETWSQY